MVGKWYCKEYQIDMTITGFVDDDNSSHLSVEIKDRNGFLLGNEKNVLKGEDLILDEDRFIWDMFDDGVKFRVLLKDSKIQFSKLDDSAEDEEAVIVSFVRKLNSSAIDNEVSKNVDQSVKANVDADVK